MLHVPWLLFLTPSDITVFAKRNISTSKIILRKLNSFLLINTLERIFWFMVRLNSAQREWEIRNHKRFIHNILHHYTPSLLTFVIQYRAALAHRLVNPHCLIRNYLLSDMHTSSLVCFSCTFERIARSSDFEWGFENLQMWTFELFYFPPFHLYKARVLNFYRVELFRLFFHVRQLWRMIARNCREIW